MRIERIEQAWGAEALRPAVGWKVWRVEDGSLLKLLAPNRFVVDWVQTHCLEEIRSWCRNHARGGVDVVVEVGSRPVAAPKIEKLTLEPEVRSTALPAQVPGMS